MVHVMTLLAHASNYLTEIASKYNVITVKRKEDKPMPNLRHLLDDLGDMGVEPNTIRIPGQLYDDMVADAEESIEENPVEEE
jgi:hypothetical protein